MTTTFYKKEGTNYTVKMNKIFPIIGFILFAIVEIYFLFFATETKDSTMYKIIPLFPMTLSLIELGKKTLIDLERKIIETSIFGIFNKKQIQFNEIKRFVTTQHKTNFMNNGVSLSLEVVKDGKTETLQIAKLNKSTNIEKLLNETKELIKL